jgi:hypothetical protein
MSYKRTTEFARGEALAIELGIAQTLFSSFGHREIHVGKNEQRPRKASVYLTYWQKR